MFHIFIVYDYIVIVFLAVVLINMTLSGFEICIEVAYYLFSIYFDFFSQNTQQCKGIGLFLVFFFYFDIYTGFLTFEIIRTSLQI